MAFATIAGIDLDGFVLVQGAEREEPHPIGDPPEEVSDGTLVSTVQGYKHRWRLQVGPLTRTAANALETAIGTGYVDVAGELFFGAATTFAACVEILGWRPVKDRREATDAKWILSLRVREV